MDQLSGSDMPLDAMMGLFATEADARHVIAVYLEKGIVSILEAARPCPGGVHWVACATPTTVRAVRLTGG